MKATIFDIERASFANGPGIRTTVFFKGCNLKCSWCHNPESQSTKKEILFYKSKCTACGKCKSVSPFDADFFCPNDAKELCGKTYDTEEIFNEIAKDKSFYETSGGGVTFSGGECMLQIEFLTQILKICKQNDIHTAVDTAGNVPWEYFEKIMPYTDLFLYDIKSMNNSVHQKYTKVPNTLILKNLERLLKSDVHVWVRVPVIAKINDTREEMKNIKAFFEKNAFPQKTELLPYHNMGEHKYSALGKEAMHFEAPSSEKLEALKNLIM